MSARTARRVVLGVPEETADSHRAALADDTFRTYLRRAHDTVAVGETWEEFVSGGCGRRTEIRLEVLEADGERIGPETTFVYR